MTPARNPAASAAALALLLAACAKKEEPSSAPPSPAPPSLTQYYYDLGPAAVDVSGYPPEQRENYKLVLSVCGACHTPARPLNAPYAGADTWKRFVRRMHVKMESRGVVMAPGDEERVMSFLVYDSKARKTDRKAEFQALQESLKKRFEEASTSR